MTLPDSARGPWDVVIAGAGAAGLAAAIFTRMRDPARSVLLLDGARRPGAKILVSGGGRCNVTNTVVTERDYWGGPAPIVRRVLRAFPVDRTVEFFERAGVMLHPEHDGKLFPDSNSARQVLGVLLRLASDHGVALRPSHRVLEINHDPRGVAAPFRVVTAAGGFDAVRVVLATGGQSLPKTGSDGVGYAFARGLGHSIVETTPALAPLVLDGSSNGGLHEEIKGVSVDARLTLWVDGAAAVRLRESLLWTHFGISGPVALNMSRHWLRARLEGRRVGLTASFVPDMDYQALDGFWTAESRNRPRAATASALAQLVPASMGAALTSRLAIDPSKSLAHLTREERRRLTRALLEHPLPVTGSRGYSYAEATAGGVDLREIDARTMESRLRPGLYLIGEILDVDGRLGGFNFQWAWSSAYVAAAALARG